MSYIVDLYLHWKYLNDRVAASNSQPKSPLDKRLLGVSVKCMLNQKYDSTVKCYWIKIKNKKYNFSTLKKKCIY